MTKNLTLYSLLFALMCAASCSVKHGSSGKHGSYNASQAYAGHFEGPKTGQATIHLDPSLKNGSAGIAYALNRNIFVQTHGYLSYSYLELRTGVNLNAASHIQIGGYLYRKGYQCLTASVGGGTGTTSFVRDGLLFGRFHYNQMQGQLGVSENYGASRISLGLSYRASNLYRGKIFIGGDLNRVANLVKVAEQKFTHTLSGNLAYSVRIRGPLRLGLNFDFTFYGMDYSLFERTNSDLAIFYDIGNMSRPKKSKPKTRKKEPKQHLDHEEELQD